MVRPQTELQKAFMSTFTKDYFLTHYGKSDKKNPLYKLESYRREVMQAVPQNRSKFRILDVGCGYGAFLSLLEGESRFETYGTDTSTFAIKEAKKRTQKTKFWAISLDNFHPKKNFHVVTAFDVLEHIVDLDRALEKIYDLLEKDGKFLCVVPVYDGIMGRVGGLLDKDITHIHKKSRKFWINKLKDKFIILKVIGIVRYNFPLVGYLYVKSNFLANWGQAILISMVKPQKTL